eukprot:COSAG01_NODE_406_length_17453_cov_83.218105_2_plen_176_part_00
MSRTPQADIAAGSAGPHVRRVHGKLMHAAAGGHEVFVHDAPRPCTRTSTLTPAVRGAVVCRQRQSAVGLSNQVAQCLPLDWRQRAVEGPLPGSCDCCPIPTEHRGWPCTLTVAGRQPAAFSLDLPRGAASTPQLVLCMPGADFTATTGCLDHSTTACGRQRTHARVLTCHRSRGG